MMDALFQLFFGDLTALKKQMSDILKDVEFRQVFKELRCEAGQTLALKCIFKDHKPQIPLRLAVNERTS